MWDGFSSSFHSLGLGFHFFGDKRACFRFLMLFLVGLASVSIDFYFVLNSFFLRAKVANWNGEGLSCIFFFHETGFCPGFSQQRLVDKW